MKAMILERFSEKLGLQEVPRPSPGRGEILIRCRAAGLCGSDLKITGGKIATTPLPIIPGHEIAGDVVEAGDATGEALVGKRVVSHLYVSCGACPACAKGAFNLCPNLRGRLGFELNGGLGEYVVVPAANAVEIPDGVSFVDACVAPCAMLAIYHGINRAAPVEGDSVVVLGVGGLGIHGVQFLAGRGLRVVAVDINPVKLEKALSLGADEAMTFDEFSRHPGPWSVVLDNVGKPDVTSASHAKLDRSGAYVMVAYAPGVPSLFDSEHMHLFETRILGTRNGSMGELRDIMRLMGEGKVRAVVDTTLPLSRANEALEMIRAGGCLGRVVIDMGL